MSNTPSMDIYIADTAGNRLAHILFPLNGLSSGKLYIEQKKYSIPRIKTNDKIKYTITLMSLKINIFKT